MQINEKLELPPLPPPPPLSRVAHIFPDAPIPPYLLRDLEVYGGRKMLAKLYPLGFGPILDDDEVKLWAYVRWLEDRLLAITVGTPAKPSPTAPEPPSPGQNPDTHTAHETAHPDTPSGAAPTTEDAPSNDHTDAPAPTSLKRMLAEGALLATPGDSNVAIAARIGVSDELVRKVRKELEAAGRLSNTPTSAPKETTEAPAASGVGEVA